jgi:hypothetical protein
MKKLRNGQQPPVRAVENPLGQGDEVRIRQAVEAECGAVLYSGISLPPNLTDTKYR